MSRLEDKLSASIKPAKGKTTTAAKTGTKAAGLSRTAKPAAPPRAEATAAPTAASPARTEEAARPLHPRRIWPD